MRTQRVVKIFLLGSVVAFLCAAQLDRVSMKLMPETSIWLTGGSEDYPWSCSVDALDGSLSFESTTDGKKVSVAGIPSASVTVPVKSLNCGHPQADRDLQRAMKAEANPDIRFELISSEIVGGDGEAEFVVHATGRILAAGAERAVTMDVQGELMEDGSLQFRGEVPLSMSEFAIEPPAGSKLSSVQEFVVHFYAVAGI